ncbi:MAG: double zinc ribbon domain-containing protein [Burkholderiales bacterium]
MSNSTLRSLYKSATGAGRDAARALDAALPAPCALCGAPAGPAALCAPCLDDLTATAAACPRCALGSADGGPCAACRAHPPSFDASLAGGAYDFPLSNLIRRLKYGGALELAPAAALPLEVAVARTGAARRVDALVAMPLVASRQRSRGYNQAREIAKSVAAAFDLPLADGLVRVVESAPQASLPWRARVRNVRGAFGTRRRYDGLAIALVDDVMTTGATAAAAAAALRRAGAARVEVWVAARTRSGDTR